MLREETGTDLAPDDRRGTSSLVVLADETAVWRGREPPRPPARPSGPPGTRLRSRLDGPGRLSPQPVLPRRSWGPGMHRPPVAWSGSPEHPRTAPARPGLAGVSRVSWSRSREPRRSVAADTGTSDRVRRCPRLAAGGASRPMGNGDTRHRPASTRVGAGPPASTKRPGLVYPESRHPSDALPTRFRPREGPGPDGGAGRRCAPTLADDRNVAWSHPGASVTRRRAPRRPRTGPHTLRRRSARRHPDRAAHTRLAGSRGCPRDVVASARPIRNPRHQLRAPARARPTDRAPAPFMTHSQPCAFAALRASANTSGPSRRSVTVPAGTHWRGSSWWPKSPPHRGRPLLVPRLRRTRLPTLNRV